MTATQRHTRTPKHTNGMKIWVYILARVVYSILKTLFSLAIVYVWLCVLFHHRQQRTWFYYSTWWHLYKTNKYKIGTNKRERKIPTTIESSSESLYSLREWVCVIVLYCGMISIDIYWYFCCAFTALFSHIKYIYANVCLWVMRAIEPLIPFFIFVAL